MATKMQHQALKSFIVNTLRRSSWRWYAWSNAKKKAKIGRNQYVCNICKGVFGNKDIVVDHIVPVVDPITGWVDFDTWIKRMFVTEDGFQIICRAEHDLKSKAENVIRKENKLTKKKE